MGKANQQSNIKNQAIVNHVGQTLRTLRQSSGQSLMCVAQMAQVDISYLSAAERGSHALSIQKLAALCDALNISLSDFFHAIENRHHH